MKLFLLNDDTTMELFWRLEWNATMELQLLLPIELFSTRMRRWNATMELFATSSSDRIILYEDATKMEHDTTRELFG